MTKRSKAKRKKRVVETKHSIYQKNYTQYRDYTDGESRAPRRGEKKSPCSEAERLRKRAINMKSSAEKVSWLIEQIFEKQDLHVVLKFTTEGGRLQLNDKQITAILARFARLLRADYKARGNELKYIFVFERGEETGAKKRHVHMIVNSVSRPKDSAERKMWAICDDETPRIMRERWEKAQKWGGCAGIGAAYVKPIISKGTIGDYLRKEFYDTLYNLDYLDGGIHKRYSRSKNLIMPKAYYEDIDTGETILETSYAGMALDADSYSCNIDNRGNITESARFYDIGE